MSDVKHDLKCRDCGHPSPATENGWDTTDHAEDCAGVARGIVTLDHA